MTRHEIWSTRGTLLYAADTAGVAETVVRAVTEDVSLGFANLCDADLSKAELSYADLAVANLSFSDLERANLCGADLRAAQLCYANLNRANLRGANLADADLRCVDLKSTNLRGANVAGARLPSPTTVLLAYWGRVSDELCADLMVYDASCHPDPTRFDEWARGGNCPYAEVGVERAANFIEKRYFWGKGKPCRPYDLMVRVLAECCPQWDSEKLDAFEETKR